MLFNQTRKQLLDIVTAYDLTLKFSNQLEIVRKTVYKVTVTVIFNNNSISCNIFKAIQVRVFLELETVKQDMNGT